MSTPYVGQIVHYAPDLAPCRAAIVTDVPDQPNPLPDGYVLSATLSVFDPVAGLLSFPEVLNGSPVQSGTWHWLEGCAR